MASINIRRDVDVSVRSLLEGIREGEEGRTEDKGRETKSLDLEGVNES